jgi:hypothetical protein
LESKKSFFFGFFCKERDFRSKKKKGGTFTFLSDKILFFSDSWHRQHFTVFLFPSSLLILFNFSNSPFFNCNVLHYVLNCKSFVSVCSSYYVLWLFLIVTFDLFYIFYIFFSSFLLSKFDLSLSFVFISFSR